jgi:uncharacterized membrane protein YeaQ/YmgE (transglycosylase-associated protein family)
MMWLLWVIIVGFIAGAVAGRIMGKGGYGPVMDIVLGILGGIVGGFLLSLVGLNSSGGLIGEIVVAIVGAVFLIWISRMRKKAWFFQTKRARHFAGPFVFSRLSQILKPY